MAKIASFLNQRFLKKDKSKMNALVERANEGNLTSFSGIFGVLKIDPKDKDALLELLRKYAPQEEIDLEEDAASLLSITAEVKAIQNQAAILHGERIKKAQSVLKKYRDGAFSSWLLSTYGNRQTPYNFLQYYEFYLSMPKTLHTQIESMPRQAIYTLASRDGDALKKEEIVRNYKGETKQQLITLIRTVFPLSEGDKRRENISLSTQISLERLISLFGQRNIKMTKPQKKSLLQSLKTLTSLVESVEISE